MMNKICACVSGGLLAIALLPAASAAADTTDADFNSYLNNHGVHLGSAAQTVDMARMMCKDLDSGFTQKDEVDVLTGAHRLNPDQAKLFVGAATADYCPNHHNASPPAKS
ncbi:DUF732 domain-containing protein [Mycobacterium sp. Marseille-P9652]|uniref:DUF732 domain-containing protein n=1 Tax=Mycobacterium sp. Marseille-P9652 TaxID=2654950 RepID=UPI0018D0196D|nr:DUF732 domain-containing protein [Mycobacterium sp. Marseille-P9652]